MGHPAQVASEQADHPSRTEQPPQWNGKKRSWGLRPIFFGPGTLWRTWGTRPVSLIGVWSEEAWSQGSGIPLKPKPGLTPISCNDVLERSACAPFIKERRMESISATSLHRKSGQWGT